MKFMGFCDWISSFYFLSLLFWFNNKRIKLPHRLNMHFSHRLNMTIFVLVAAFVSSCQAHTKLDIDSFQENNKSKFHLHRMVLGSETHRECILYCWMTGQNRRDLSTFANHEMGNVMYNFVILFLKRIFHPHWEKRGQN